MPDAPALTPEALEELRILNLAQERARRRRARVVLGASALAHAAILAIASRAIPEAPPSPRRVEVLSFSAVPLPGGAAVEWRNVGGVREARISPEPRRP